MVLYCKIFCLSIIKKIKKKDLWYKTIGLWFHTIYLSPSIVFVKLTLVMVDPMFFSSNVPAPCTLALHFKIHTSSECRRGEP